MKTNEGALWLVGLMAVTFAAGACAPKTRTQKIEDKAEDVGHETKQGVERAGEKIDNATK